MYGELISSVTVGTGGASSIDFTSIPGTYTDLVLVVSPRLSIDSSTALMRFNDDSADNYYWRSLQGTGSSVSSSNGGPTDSLRFPVNPSGATSNTFGNTIINIPNYSGSTAKSLSIDAVTENNGTTALQHLYAGRWAGTSAITKISLLANFAQYSTAYLYGLTKGSGGATVS